MSGMSSESWIRHVIASTPLWLAFVAVLVTAMVIIKRRRVTGVLLICAACLGLTTMFTDPLLGDYFFGTLTNQGWTFEAAHMTYMLIMSVEWGIIVGLFLWASLSKSAQTPSGAGFSVYPHAPAYMQPPTNDYPFAGQPQYGLAPTAMRTDLPPQPGNPK